ncbi:MAG: dTDP-glucose 4,6-dehydratase [Candidatus Omnitrophica bacterium]|nr:dTDP-glucose 4,6-dehydratase [Candidatus Omnitrophota bacterium]
MSVQTVIVTGGAGFIGSNLVRRLLNGSLDRVVVLDKLTYAGNRASLADLEAHPRLVFLEADIADLPRMREVFKTYDPSGVINLAAESHVDRSIESPAEFIHTNVNGTFALLQASLDHFCGLEEQRKKTFRFLHVSTDEVYGSLPREGLFTEETPYAPNSPYAASKASADHLVRAYAETYGLPGLITNCSNNFGPYQFPEKLIPLMLLNALEARALPIYGDGLHVRDWLFVEDHCEGLELVYRRAKPGQKYNIGGSSEKTNLEIVDTLCEVLEKFRPAAENPALQAKGLTHYGQLKSFVPDRPGHDRRYAIDASKINRELGWAPRRSFEKGMTETVRWYLENEAWCRSVQQGKYGRERLGFKLKTQGETR